jgi:hypothetical protein
MMAKPDEFQARNHPDSGTEDAAKGFFDREQRRNSIKRGDMAPSEMLNALPEDGKRPAPPLVDQTPLDPEQEAVVPPDAVESLGVDPPEDGLAPDPEIESSPVLGGEADDEVVEAAGADPESFEIPNDAMVTLPDGSQATFSDLQKGYMKNGDYTRKTIDLSNNRKEFDEKVSKASEAFKQRGAQLDGLARALQEELSKNQVTPQQLETLRATDPAEYAAVSEDLRRKRELLNHAHIQQQQLAQDWKKRQDAEQRQRIPIEREALQSLSKAFRDNFDDTYSRVGNYVISPDGGNLQPEEWDQAVDHRFVRLAEKAMYYDEATRKDKPGIRKQLAGKPRVVRPGIQRDAGDTHSEQQAALMKRLKADPENHALQKEAWLLNEQRRSRVKAGGQRGRT